MGKQSLVSQVALGEKSHLHSETDWSIWGVVQYWEGNETFSPHSQCCLSPSAVSESMGTGLPCCLCPVYKCTLATFLCLCTWRIGWMQEMCMWAIVLSFRVLLNWLGFALLTCLTICEDRFSRQPNAIMLHIELSFKYEVTWDLFPCCNWSLYFCCWVPWPWIMVLF